MLQLKKKITQFRSKILSRHPSHRVLRAENKNLPLLPFRSLIRFGSLTELNDGIERIELNTIDSIRNSSNKLLMKQKFTEVGVKTADWLTYKNGSFKAQDTDLDTDIETYPIVAKHHFGSKGRGNTLIKTEIELEQWMIGKNLNNYIFEKFMNYGHEFRLHISKNGCFYTCRKALKQNVAEEDKWRRHDDICVWFLEESEHFYKPNSWNDIISDCVKALHAIGADILSFDVRVQTPNDKNGIPREYQDYILLECNSASSMDNGKGEISICAQKYIEEIPKLLKDKYNAIR